MLATNRKKPLSITVDQSTIPESIIVGKFDEAKIKATIVYSNDTTETIEITKDMLGEYEEYTNQPGTWEVVVCVENVTATFSINVIEEPA